MCVCVCMCVSTLFCLISDDSFPKLCVYVFSAINKCLLSPVHGISADSMIHKSLPIQDRPSAQRGMTWQSEDVPLFVIFASANPQAYPDFCERSVRTRSRSVPSDPGTVAVTYFVCLSCRTMSEQDTEVACYRPVRPRSICPL